MNLLLDTHAFLWLDAEPSRLSARAVELCEDRANELFLSLVSVWEIQIKVQLGKLTLNSPLSEIISLNQRSNRIRLLPISLAHIYGLSDLDDHHRDPFDRLLIAQAKVENLVLLSGDVKIKKYPVDVIW